MKTTIHPDYLKLIRRFPLRPIRNKKEYDIVVELMNELAVCDEGSLSPGEADYLDTVSMLVEKYDDEHHPIPNVTPLTMLKHVMAESGATQVEIASLLGIGTSAMSMILSGSREITAGHARALGRRFAVDPGLFV